MVSAAISSLHLLSIDLGSAPSSLRAVLELGPSDIEHWLKRAQVAGAPLAIVSYPERVDLYTSEAGRRAAFKPLLESLWSLGRNLEGFESVRTCESSGHAVARHLLRQAAGLDSAEHGVSRTLCIFDAERLAQRFGTMNDELHELFELARATAERSQAETELSAPCSTRASRQVEVLGAERIVEEELMAFRVAAANDQARSSVPAARTSLPPYSSEEPGSCVRMRIAPFSLVPVSTRKSS
jgi:glutamyl-tRNA reductase